MSITEFVESPGYKKVMGKVYGWGASVVILGALWKILHLPGASLMLIAGLGTESIIFFLSAFEPPHAMPDWSLVYPELVGLEPNENRGRGGVGGGGSSDLAALIESGSLEPEIVEKLAEGIKKLTLTTGQLSDLSDANFATESYLQSMKSASESISKLSSSQMESVKTLENSASALAQSYSSTADVIANSGTKIAHDLTQSGEKLLASYSSLSSSINNEAEQISVNSRSYSEQLKDMNKNLGAINSIFELQLKASNEQVQMSEAMTKGLKDIKDQLVDSVSDTKNYKEQVAKLSSSISDLNNIYGNMLSAMNGRN
ncbi:MAG: gliding motility protein GldL [Marinilabiliaceae bacterium]|nr:gliding motility protein GldL [Marinilabiliaceae bacterium]